MAILSYRLSKRNGSGGSDVVHLETSANLVLMAAGGTVESAVSTINTALETIQNAIAVINGSGNGSISKQVADAIAAVVAEAPEAYDTLKEMSDWISSHETSAAAMNSQINQNKTDIATLNAKITASTTDLTAGTSPLETGKIHLVYE